MKQLQDENIDLRWQRDDLAPKATYHNAELQFNKGILTTTLAKLYDMAGRNLNALLDEWGIIRQRGEEWYLCPEYQGKGYARCNGRTGHGLVWTKEGATFVRMLMEKHGHYPVCDAI